MEKINLIMKKYIEKFIGITYRFPIISHTVTLIIGLLLMFSYYNMKKEYHMDKDTVLNHNVFIYFDKKIDELKRIKLKNEFRTKIFQNHFMITYTTQRDNLQTFLTNSNYENMDYDKLYKEVLYMCKETNIEIRKKQTQINIPEIFLSKIDTFTNGSYSLFLAKVDDIFLDKNKTDKKYNNDKMYEFCDEVHKKWLKIDDALPYVLDNMNGSFKAHKTVFIDPNTKKEYNDFDEVIVNQVTKNTLDNTITKNNPKKL